MKWVEHDDAMHAALIAFGLGMFFGAALSTVARALGG